MIGGYLCISKAKMLLLSPLNPPSDKVSPDKGPFPSALVGGSRALEKEMDHEFDGSAIASNGIGVVLSCEDGDTVPFSFKLEFPYSNNATEYEVYLTELTIALGIGIKDMRMLGDSNLVVSQVKGDFTLREPSLASH